jgi:hypothetical protein
MGVKMNTYRILVEKDRREEITRRTKIRVGGKY